MISVGVSTMVVATVPHRGVGPPRQAIAPQLKRRRGARVKAASRAAEYYLDGANPPAAALVTAALAWRLEPPSAGEATALLSRELIPLYIQYLDDHIARLRAIDRHELAGRFQRWRARLLAPNP